MCRLLKWLLSGSQGQAPRSFLDSAVRPPPFCLAVFSADIGSTHALVPQCSAPQTVFSHQIPQLRLFVIGSMGKSPTVFGIRCRLPVGNTNILLWRTVNESEIVKLSTAPRGIRTVNGYSKLATTWPLNEFCYFCTILSYPTPVKLWISTFRPWDKSLLQVEHQNSSRMAFSNRKKRKVLTKTVLNLNSNPKKGTRFERQTVSKTSAFVIIERVGREWKIHNRGNFQATFPDAQFCD